MKKSVLVFSMTSLLLFGGMNMAIAQEQLELPRGYYTKIKIIRKVLKQQQEIFETGKSVPDRIVSISKSYIRPIVRGKEVKAVEFGAKVNMVQFDGINFIEHLSFDAFNEGTRLVKSIRYGRSLFGKISLYRPMTFMTPMQIANTVPPHTL